MTWNIAEGSMTGGLPKNSTLPRIAEIIRANTPDLVLLNEVKHEERELLGSRVQQTKWLRDKTGLPFAHWANTNRTGLTGHKAVSILSRHPLGKARKIPVTFAGKETGFAMVTATVVIDEVTHHIFSLRYAPVHTGNEKFKYRLEEKENIAGHEQAVALLKKLDSREPVIFGGDFNSSSDSPQFTYFSQHSGMTNVFASGGPDYIFYRGPYEILKAEQIAPEDNPSDHPFIVVDLQRR
jgi:endonuclease/exonuclease/phosphatase (EEP) superfamily protein YafD